MAENRLTRYELELMDVLWTLKQGTVQDVCDRLERNLAYTTVMTTLNLLAVRKQVLSREKQGRAFVYRPIVTRDEVCRSVLSDLKAVLFGNQMSSLVLNMIAEDEANESDAAILRDALRRLEENRE
ncbi:MAG: BlaI/MecI/CopY family transcriptional regulator [Planctomycetaceae bacterium]